MIVGRKRVLTTVLVLGAGAGLKASEILSVTAAEHVGRHPGDKRLWVIKLSDRIVPVRVAFVEALKDLCSRYPVGPLIGRVSQRVNDPMGAMIKGIELPAHLPPLRCRRLRITWMVSILSDDVRISEFQTLAGTVSAKSLEGLAPYIPVRVKDREYFFKAAGLDARREPAIVDPVTNQVLRRAIAAVDSEFAATVQERMTATVGRHWAVLLARSGHFYCPPMGSFP